MYRIIKSVIEKKDFKLEDILHKINEMRIKSFISKEQTDELEELARQNAKPENSYDLQKQLDRLEERVKKLEEANSTTEETTEEYPMYVQPTGAHDSYGIGSKITYTDGKRYICQIANCVWAPDVYPQGWKEVVEESVESEG